MVAATPLAAARRRRAVPHGTALVSICLVLIAGFTLGANLFMFSQTSDGSAEGDSDAASYNAQQRRLLSASYCSAYADIVQAASERPEPQLLSQAQLLWLAALVQSQEKMNARPILFLVFGYHSLSDVLQAVNCQGRTVFLEGSLPQIDAVRQEHPFLEVHLVHYKGQAGEADSFLAAPWLMDMPQEVDSQCFDVVLIDGPPGTGDAGEPARLESSYYALENARRCILERELDEVLLLLHDSQRPMEQRVVRELLLAPDITGETAVQTLGTIRDAGMGDLAAFRVLPTGPPPEVILQQQEEQERQERQQRGAAAFLRRLSERAHT